MTDKKHSRNQPIEVALTIITTGFLLVYTYAALFAIPYVGFDFIPGSGTVIELFVDAPPEASLQLGDEILQIGELTIAQFRQDRTLTFSNLKAGNTVPIHIQRGGQELTIDWVIPGPNQMEIKDRLINTWWLAYIFWFFGLATYLFVRPKDLRRRLLIAAHYLTAIWLVAGALSTWHVWMSSIVLHMATWLYAPVLLHLHWVFPKPLGKLPGWLLWSSYILAAGLSVGELFQALPRSTYFIGFILAVGGTVILLVIRYFRPNQDRQLVGFLAIVALLAFLPSIGASIISMLGAPSPVTSLTLFGLPLLPGAYFYAAYRRQLDNLELRANRLLSIYLFIILLSVCLLALVPWINRSIPSSSSGISTAIIASLVAALLGIFGFPGFKRFIERHLLGMPLPPTHLRETYAARIGTSLSTDNLSHLLKDEILPSLMVRQSALVRISDTRQVISVYIDGIPDDNIPGADVVSTLVTTRRAPYRFQPENGNILKFSWIQIAFPLEVEGELIGLWLLGSRPPDNFYAQNEVAILQTIANQVALALVNIAQAERLRAVFEANIARVEDERTALARELHDEVLNQLAVLATNRNGDHSKPIHPADFQALTGHIRRMVSGLRPSMLTYGLGPALDELVDDFTERVEGKMNFQADIKPSTARFDPEVEVHLYRITQQACENAWRHAQATLIRISGRLEPVVNLTIEDDGIGLPENSLTDYKKLLEQKHFGLVGLMERAEVIGAKVRIESHPETGTRVHLTWHPDQDNHI